MRKVLFPFLPAVAVLMSAGLPATAHEARYQIERPYVIEQICDDDGTSCKDRMVYAPGQNPGLAGYGSYWYPRATRSVHVVDEDLPYRRRPIEPDLPDSKNNATAR